MNSDAASARIPVQDAPAPRSAAPLRLAFCIERFFEFGGLQRDLRRIALAAAARGDEVHILTRRWDGERPAPLQIHVLDCDSITNHGRQLAFTRSVREFVSRESFDCVIGFNKIPGVDIYWAGDPCLAAKLPRAKRLLAGWLPRYRAYLGLEAGVLGSSSRAEILVLAEAERERIARHYAPDPSRLHLIPPGIDRDCLLPLDNPRDDKAVLREELGIGEREQMLLTVASSFYTKGVDRSMRALAALPDPLHFRTRMVVVGTGRRRPMERLARRLNVADRVIFTGGRGDVGRFYRAADLLIHPARTETAGHTLLEAMVCGLPVLATESCGYAAHVDRAQAGRICPEPFRQGTLNSLLAEMLACNSPNAWRTNALAYCSQHDLYNLVEKTVDLIVARAQLNRRAA